MQDSLNLIRRRKMCNLPVEVDLNLTALRVLDTILENATLHPKEVKKISWQEATYMTDEELTDVSVKIVSQLRDFPNIDVLRVLILRYKKLVREANETR